MVSPGKHEDMRDVHLLSTISTVCWFIPRYTVHQLAKKPSFTCHQCQKDDGKNETSFSTSHSSHISMIPKSLARESGYLDASVDHSVFRPSFDWLVTLDGSWERFPVSNWLIRLI